MAAKKESKAQRKEEEAAMAPARPPADDAARSAKKAKKSKKEKSKGRKRARRDSDAEGEAAAAPAAPRAPEPPQEERDASASATTDKGARKAARAAKKAAKTAAKSNLLERLPKVDADGLPFNKIQIRRMLRRAKHGLPPIATEEEEREIKRREKRERIEEEALYSATADDGASGRGKVENEGVERKENEPREADGPEEVDDNDNNSSDHDEGGAVADDGPEEKAHRNPPPKKKAKRSKPVPADYICQACHNQLDDFAPHWIYDCPQKKTKRGCNQVAKKLRGLHDPPSRKVFVSGLPFDCDEGMVKRYFEEGMLREKSAEMGDSKEGAGGALGEDHELVHCKLLTFEDSKRCKGTGFLTFGSDAGAKLALKLNGAVWREVEEPGTKSKKKKGKKGGEVGEERKELRLKVSKVLNRRVTKQQQRGKKQG